LIVKTNQVVNRGNVSMKIFVLLSSVVVNIYVKIYMDYDSYGD